MADFEGDKNAEWFEVHAGAVTNTNPGSMVYVKIDMTPICPNMTDGEFRAMASRLLKWSIIATDRRLADLERNDSRTRERMRYWFDRTDETTRQYLIAGFSSVSTVLKSLKATNFVRSDPDLDRQLGCTPNLKNVEREAAHVCSPNTSRRLISIGIKFCNGLRDQNMYADSRLSTLIHEVTHFSDTFASTDSRYGIDAIAADWSRRNPERALGNADSLTGYVLYDEPIFAA
ncbi:M35 family metallo-endopeptidase [Paraburkholderia phenoliruptrix]|uniref:M35 family metallo-endopeptidase n=1 Tax=Paraburkholderia phenoliruptrix TaxID=252970 RepID=UPI002869D14F|nr:M35 family metallo-endopeptidase [Paraburkholderia phenoliruptrix]WMY06934.1 M35 family metallo-endopeptidase [Paraburkholderia phenoliruptrix]